jgi:hypothetical protein
MSRCTFVFALMLTAPAWCQSPGRDAAAGAADIGKGALDVGKGTAGAVGNLATGHPVSAAASLGRGGAHAAVNTGKGVGKIGKGVGGGLKKLAHL